MADRRGSYSSGAGGTAGDRATRLDVSSLVQLFRSCFQLDCWQPRWKLTGWVRIAMHISASSMPIPHSRHRRRNYHSLWLTCSREACLQVLLRAVRHAQIGLGLGDPDIPNMPRLEYIIKGHHRKSVKGGGRPHLPITPAILSALKAVWSLEGNRFTTSMLWVASCLCFFLFSWGPGRLWCPQIHLSTPPFTCASRMSRWIRTRPLQFLPCGWRPQRRNLFRKGFHLSSGVVKGPVAAVLSYMVLRSSGPGPLFLFGDGSYLTRPHFVSTIWSALACAGIDSKLYSDEFSDWGSEYGGLMQDSGLFNQGVGKVAELCLPIICSYTAWSS